jgi:hypothetical protein
MAAPKNKPEQVNNKVSFSTISDKKSKQSIKQLAIIDWQKVALFIEAGVQATTIAQNLGIDRKTLYNRCETDNGITYSQFARQKKSTGIAELQLAAYNAALAGATDARFTGALIFQLKSRCGLSDKPMEPKGETIRLFIDSGESKEQA